MQLPLFQGVSVQQLSALVEKMPFHFLKFSDGERIIAEGDACTHVRFVVSGKVKVSIRFSNLKLTVEQTLEAPNVLGPDYLFGLDTTYPFEASAVGECGIMQLRKADYVNIVQADKVFLFNILNYLSRNSQRFIAGLLAIKQSSVVERIALIVSILTTQLSSEVSFSFLQKDLCTLLGTQRATLIHALDNLQDEGTISYTTTQIRILDLPALRRSKRGRNA